MIMRSPHLLKAIFALLAMAGVLMACSLGDSTTTVTSTTGGVSSSTGGSSSSSTSTSTAPATCASLVPGGSAASGGSSFTDIVYPTGAIATGLVLHHSGTGQWTIYLQNACAPGTTASAVRAFYATQLPAHGWAYTPTLPFDGSYQAPCGDAYCWGKDAAPRYVGLEGAIDAGGGNVTFTLRLFVPPPAPNCSAGDTLGIYSGKTYQSTWDEAHVPLPPLTLYGIGDGYSNSTSSHDTVVGMCSAGNAASVNTFFNTELPRVGYTHGSPPVAIATACMVTSPVWYKGNTMFSWTVVGGTVPNGIIWQMSECTAI